MRNSLTDLHNHLFMQLERLSDEELKGDALTEEIARSRAVTDVAQKIVANASLVLEAHDRLTPLESIREQGKLRKLYLPEP